ncbi:MAG: hypothetical protein RLZ97_2059 [Verrucomicrobiota bacterium]|jgi:hypothetical protein
MNAILRTLAFAAISLNLATADEAAEEKWIPLFNGKDLDGWTPKIADFPLGENPGKVFRVEDGLLKISYDQEPEFKGQFGHLFYKTPYSHYRIRGEVRFTGDQQKGGPGWAFRNNGFMLHCQKPATMTVDQKFPNSVEMQFLGNDPAKGFSGRRMGNVFTPGTKIRIDGQDHEGGDNTSSSEAFSGDEWVTVEAEVHGSELIIHYANGKEVLRYTDIRLDDGTPLGSGYIAIQAETHPTEFRKIEILPLEGNSSEEKP